MFYFIKQCPQLFELLTSKKLKYALSDILILFKIYDGCMTMHFLKDAAKTIHTKK